MRRHSEKQALERLGTIKAAFIAEIAAFEQAAESCLTCSTPGACCLDAHFVNVHISRLEAVAIGQRLAVIDPKQQERVGARIDAAIDRYELSETGDTFAKTFACPLFEKGNGCLAHGDTKPVPCIAHACYKNAADLPHDELQTRQEKLVDDLNDRTYGPSHRWLPLPVALRKYTG